MTEALQAAPFDNDLTNIAAAKTVQVGQSHLPYTLDFLQSHPGWWSPKDIATALHENPATIRKQCSRLNHDRKIASDEHGKYCYDPEKVQVSMLDLVRSGQWKVENLTFVTKGARGGSVTSPKTGIRTSKPGYPRMLPTGQQIHWELDGNGTQTVRVAANKRPPYGADHALTLIDELEREGMTEKNGWYCSCYELNQDSRAWHTDGNISVQVLKGLLLKIYAHGYNTRIEIADRRKTPMRDVKDLLHSMVKGVDTQGLIREMEARDKRYTEGIAQADARSRHTYGALTEVKNDQKTIIGALTALTDAVSQLQRDKP